MNYLEPTNVIEILYTMRPEPELKKGFLLLYPGILFFLSNQTIDGRCHRNCDFRFQLEKPYLEGHELQEIKFIKHPFKTINEIPYHIDSLKYDDQLFFRDLLQKLSNNSIANEFRHIINLKFIGHKDYNLNIIGQETEIILMCNDEDWRISLSNYASENMILDPCPILCDNYFCIMPHTMDIELIKFNSKKNHLEFNTKVSVVENDADTLETLSKEVPIYFSNTLVYDTYRFEQLQGILVITESAHIIFIEKWHDSYKQKLKFPLIDLKPEQSDNSNWKTRFFNRDRQNNRCRFLSMQEKHSPSLTIRLNKIEHVISFKLIELHMDMDTYIVSNDIGGQDTFTFVQRDFEAYDFIQRLLKVFGKCVENTMKLGKYTREKVLSDFAETLKDDILESVIEGNKERMQAEYIDQTCEEVKNLGPRTGTILSQENKSLDMSTYICSRMSEYEKAHLEYNWTGLGNETLVKDALMTDSDIESFKRDTVILNLGLESISLPDGPTKLKKRFVKMWNEKIGKRGSWFQTLVILIFVFSLLFFILSIFYLATH